MRALRELGVANGLLYLLARCLATATLGTGRLIRYHFLAQPVHETRLLPEGGANRIRVEQIRSTDPLAEQMPRPPEVVRARFAAGALCFAASLHGRLVGCLWLKAERYDEDEVRCTFVPLPGGEAVWDFDVYVAPDHRLGRTFLRLWDAAYDFMRTNGIRWTISRVSAFNPGSLTAHARLGATRVGAATFVCVGSWQLALLDRKPYVHLSFGGSRGPRLELKAPAANPAKSGGSRAA